MCIVIVHSEHATEVFKYLDTFKHVLIDIKLSAKCQCQPHTSVLVKSPLLSLPTVGGLPAPCVIGVHLQSATSASGIDALSGQAHQIKGVAVIDVAAEVPSACRLTHTAQDGTE